jgi:type VII secretion protein EccB
VWTQRDQIQAYQFLRRRLVSALVTADANHPTSPSRRLVLGTIIGVAGAVLIAAAFGVVGLINPSGAADWRQGGQVIVEQETGARYVLGQDGLLHPVLNYASARLLAGGNGDQTVTVSSKTLRSASRGAMLGIPGAPDSLPPAGSLTDTVFASCSQIQPDLPANAPARSTVILGAAAPNGRPLGPGRALLVAPPGGAEYVVTAGHRFRLVDRAATAALGYESVTPVPVSTSWLDTVPAGRDLGLVDVPDAGAPGPDIGGTRTLAGQVLSGGGFYLVRTDGVEPVSETEARLALGDPANAAAYPNDRPAVVRISFAALGAAPRSATSSTLADTAADYPHAVPSAADLGTDTVLCAVGDGTDTASIITANTLPLPRGAQAMRVDTRTDGRVADQVYVPPGSGTLVRVRVGAGATTGTTYLITDAGMKYPVPNSTAVAALGYGGATARQVSGTLLALLPTGPSLDPVAARQVVQTDGGAR